MTGLHDFQHDTTECEESVRVIAFPNGVPVDAVCISSLEARLAKLWAVIGAVIGVFYVLEERIAARA